MGSSTVHRHQRNYNFLLRIRKIKLLLYECLLLRKIKRGKSEFTGEVIIKPGRSKAFTQLLIKLNKKVVVHEKHGLATLEKYNCIEKLQTEVIHSQFLHKFSLYTDLCLFKAGGGGRGGRSLADKAEALTYFSGNMALDDGCCCETEDRGGLSM